MNIRHKLHEGRTLIRAIEHAGGPPPHLRPLYRRAVGMLRDAESGDGLGLFPFILAAVATAVGMLGIVFVGVKAAQAAGGAVDAGGAAAKSAAQVVPWAALAGGAWWLALQMRKPKRKARTGTSKRRLRVVA